MRATDNRELRPLDANVLTIAQSVSLFGTSLTWTGFPILVSSETGDYRMSSILFFTSSFATVITALGLGKFVDRLNSKSTFIFGSVLSFALLASMFLLGNSDVTSFLVLAVLLSAIDTFINTSLSVWHTQVCERTNTNIRKAIAGQSLGQIAAKMLGMTAGPVLYQTIGTTGLLVDGATSLAQGLIVLFVPYLSDQVRSPYTSSERSAFQAARLRSVRSNTIALTSLLAEMTRISVPVTAILLIQKSTKDAAYISAAWLIGLTGGLAGSMFLMGRRAAKWSEATTHWISVLLCLSAVVLMGSEGVAPLCIAMGVFGAGNILFQVPLTSIIRSFKPESERGRFVSFNAAMTGFGGLVGTGVSSLMADTTVLLIFAVGSMVLLRALMMTRVRKLNETS